VTGETGIIDFVYAIPFAADQVSDLKSLDSRSWPLSDSVNEQCTRLNTGPGTDITLTNWGETSLVDYYNELKLFVLPIYICALPTGILEAMACDTQF